MKEQELSRTQVSTLACYDIAEAEPMPQQLVLEDSGEHSKLRPMRTICLKECAIPDSSR